MGNSSTNDSRYVLGGTVSIYISDMDRAIDFYTRLLGLTLKARLGNDWAEIDAGGGLIIGLHPARPPETVSPGTIGAVNVELAAITPLEPIVEALAERGVAIVGEVQNYPAVRLATLKDPDGNNILIAQVLQS